MAAGEIKSLTGLRGVAAMLVAAYHFYPVQSPLLSRTVGRFYLWVDLFFVLSGFVMALNYGRMFRSGFSGEAFGEFLLRRLARIYPLYVAVLVLQVALTLGLYGDFHHTRAWGAAVLDHPAPALLANLFLVQSWGMAGSATQQAWSISTEWGAYFTFPVLAALALFGGRRQVVLTAFAAALLLALVPILDARDGAVHSGAMDAYDGTRIAPLLRCLGGFALGVVTWRARQWRRVAALASGDWAGAAVLVLLVVLFAVGAPDLAICAAFPLLVLCQSVNEGWTARLFANPAVYRLGVLSYSVYLLHALFVLPLQRLQAMLAVRLPELIAGGIAALVTLAALLMVASGAYRLIELPGRRALRRVRLPAPRRLVLATVPVRRK
jgi:peptidoglycan/LPS O-acetylase OafA/YrhL